MYKLIKVNDYFHFWIYFIVVQTLMNMEQRHLITTHNIVCIQLCMFFVYIFKTYHYRYHKAQIQNIN